MLLHSQKINQATLCAKWLISCILFSLSLVVIVVVVVSLIIVISSRGGLLMTHRSSRNE